MWHCKYTCSTMPCKHSSWWSTSDHTSGKHQEDIEPAALKKTPPANPDCIRNCIQIRISILICDLYSVLTLLSNLDLAIKCLPGLSQPRVVGDPSDPTCWGQSLCILHCIVRKSPPGFSSGYLRWFPGRWERWWSENIHVIGHSWELSLQLTDTTRDSDFLRKKSLGATVE